MSVAADVEARVRAIVADALDRPIAEVHPHSSLINDLGAESIDFIDIVFRLESEFGLEIPQEEIWAGSIDANDEAAIAAGVERLRAAMPEFRWDALPATITKADLPALITVTTVTEYVKRRLAQESTR
jgi:acyl carrier protein